MTWRPPSNAPRELHRQLPGYTPTRLAGLPDLARRWRVGRVLAKVEDNRFGLPAFKVLGASWAVHRAIKQSRPRRLVTATDGNHGLAVAWVARQRGLAATVVVPAGTTDVRIEAIEAQGAEVQVCAGDYDAAVDQARGLADGDPGTLLVQDTWVPGHDDVPTWIVEGYGTLFHEVDDEVAPGDVDVVVVPVGVGSLAAAAVQHYGGSDATIVAAEPSDAACVQASLRAGHPVSVAGPFTTAMAGLNCGTPSTLAWPLLSARLDAAIDVRNADAERAMRALAAQGISTGATGAASVAAAGLLLSDEAARAALGIDPEATVLVLVTEGVTDPEHYAEVTG
jgi:diaminopropionate ammonia-lyase